MKTDNNQQSAGELVRDGWRVLRVGETVQPGDMQVNGGLIEQAFPAEDEMIEWQITPCPAPTFLRQNDPSVGTGEAR